MQYKICVKCVLDNSIPITFDEKGVCNFCHEWKKTEKQRKAESFHPGKANIFYRLRKGGQGKKYDCLLGLSGGVDSSMCLHYLVENEIRPLCFTIDNGWNTKESDENIMRMVEKLKVPFHRFTINLKEFGDLQNAFIQSGVKNLEISTDHILMASIYQMAYDNGIKYIISGGNHATEGIMPEFYGYQARDLRHIKAIFKKFMGRKLKEIPMISLPKYLYYRFVKGIQIINLLDFYEYRRKESVKLLEREYGYRNYGNKHCESHFTKWFQNWYLPRKFGLDKRRPHYSSMILSGQMTREEALRKLNEPLEYPQLHDEKAEEKILSYPKHEYSDYPNNLWLWNLLSRIYGTFSHR